MRIKDTVADLQELFRNRSTASAMALRSRERIEDLLDIARVELARVARGHDDVVEEMRRRRVSGRSSSNSNAPIMSLLTAEEMREIRRRQESRATRNGTNGSLPVPRESYLRAIDFNEMSDHMFEDSDADTDVLSDENEEEDIDFAQRLIPLNACPRDVNYILRRTAKPVQTQTASNKYISNSNSGFASDLYMRNFKEIEIEVLPVANSSLNSHNNPSKPFGDCDDDVVIPFI